MYGSIVKDFGDLRIVGGSLDLSNSLVQDLGKVCVVGGRLNLNNSFVTRMDGLKKAKLIWAFENFRVNDFSRLESVDRLILNPKQEYNLGKLKPNIILLTENGKEYEKTNWFDYKLNSAPNPSCAR